MKDKYTELISKPEINFWVPIVSSAVVIAMSWMMLSSRIDLMNQKLDIVIVKLDEHLADQKVLHNTLGGEISKLTLKVERLETLEGLR